MKLYRVKKLTKPGGAVVKSKDVLASNDKEAVRGAVENPDCPVCEVWREGKQIGSVL
jgi:hypothetical protein